MSRNFQSHDYHVFTGTCVTCKHASPPRFHNRSSLHCSGTKLATSSGDTTVKIWDFSKAECVHTFTDHTHAGKLAELCLQLRIEIIILRFHRVMKNVSLVYCSRSPKGISFTLN